MVSNPNDSLTRRDLLGRALGAAAMVSATEAGAQLPAQTQTKPKLSK